MKHEYSVDSDILISVIIPTYNEQRYIEQCLTSVFAQEGSEKFEVIVVDSSTDSTRSIICEKFPQVRVIHRDEQMYPGDARNRAVHVARGKIISFLDGHCLADGRWLEYGLRAMRESGCLIVGGALRNANAGNLVSVADFILAFNEFAEGMPSRQVKFMPSCNLFCTKEVFEEIGGFDGTLRAGEDTMFCHRAVQKEFRLYFDARVVVNRFNRDVFGAFMRHHYNFGRYSAQVRKEVRLPGSVFARFPLLALVVPVVRSGRIFWRLLRWNRRLLGYFLLTSSLVFLGISGWSWGFMREAFRR